MFESIAICGLVRNAEEALTKTLVSVSSIAELAHECVAVIATNDNQDSTDVILSAWQASNDRNTVLRFDGLAAHLPNKIERIAMLRNACLAHVHAQTINPEFVLILDLDGPNINVTAESIFASMLSLDFIWDGIFFNQPDAYYDIYALRHRTWCPQDCWQEVTRATGGLFGRGLFGRYLRRKAIEKFVYDRQVRIPGNYRPISVESAFGGFAIYRYESIRETWYSPRNKQGAIECEHVSFNLSISANGGQLFILPSLINDAPQEHLGSTSGKYSIDRYLSFDLFISDTR